MMQTTMLPFPYSLSCPPFVDISSNSSVTSPSPSGTPSPPVSTYMSTFYDNMFGSAAVPNSRHVLNNLPYPQHSTLNFKPSMLTSIPEKTLTKQNTCSLRRKSFTIEAILGLNQCQENAADRSHKSPVTNRDQQSAGATRVTDCRRHERIVSPNPYSVPSATPRSALTAVSTLFPDSPVKENKLKSSATNLIKDSANSREPIRVTISSSSPPSNGTTSISNSCAVERQKSGGGVSSGKTKRIRTIFTPEQLERLETEFERQQYMVGPERLYLASALNLTEAQVKVWFQNRRIKWRKQHLEIQQARLAQLREEADTAESETEPDPPSLIEEVSTSHWGELLDDRK